MKKPPLPLSLYLISYLAFLAWQLYAAYRPILLGRLVVTLVLFFFVARGSRVAGNILAILFFMGALMLLVNAIAIFNVNAINALWATIAAGLFLMFSAYLFFSPAVRAFQRKEISTPVPE